MESSTKKVDNESKWSMDVQEMPQKKYECRFSYPIFCWVFGKENDIVGGKLHAWPFHGIFIFEVRGKEIRFTSIENLLKEIDYYGWGEPPHIEEVFKDVIETKKRSPLSSLGEFEQVAEELRQKWHKLII